MAKYKNRKPTIFEDDNQTRIPVWQELDSADIIGRTSKERMLIQEVGPDGVALGGDIELKHGELLTEIPGEAPVEAISYYSNDFTVDNNTIPYFRNGSGSQNVGSGIIHFAHSYNDGMGWGADRSLTGPSFDVEIPDGGMGEHLNGFVGSGAGDSFDLSSNSFNIELEIANMDLDGSAGANVSLDISNADSSASDYLASFATISSDGTVILSVVPGTDLLGIMASANKNLGAISMQFNVVGSTVGTNPDEGLNYDITSYKLIAV